MPQPDFMRSTRISSATRTYSKLVNFTRLDLLYGLVGQAHEATDNALLVFRAGFNQQIHVHRVAYVACRANGKAADDQVPGASVIECATKLDEVLKRGLPALVRVQRRRVSICHSHSSASSCVRKR